MRMALKGFLEFFYDKTEHTFTNKSFKQNQEMAIYLYLKKCYSIFD
jgi:sucrose-6-phosphate hydrolase SacC (GH32 family)